MPKSSILKNYVYPVATLTGSIIGVGFFSLPYIASKVGIWLMLFYFLVLTFLVLAIHLIFAEISLKTPDFKRFPGFVGFHLGKFAKAITLASIIFGSFGILLIYLIVGSQFLTSLISPLIGHGNLFYALIYFLAVSSIIYFDVKTVSRFELSALVLLFASLVLVFIKGFWQMKLSNIFFSPMLVVSDWKVLFLPYGAIIFSLWGTGLIPEAEEMLGKKKKQLKKIIIISTLIPALIYVLFTFLGLAITGENTTESALVGFKNILGNGVSSIMLFAGVVTIFSAFLAQGLTLKKVFMYDMGIKKNYAWIFTCLTPLALFLFGLNSFISLLSFTGGILLGIDGLLILLMYKKINGKKLLIYPLSLVFILGIVYEIVYFVK